MSDVRFIFQEVSMEPIGAVRQHPENPNNGDAEEIATSMLVNGVYRPIWAQRSTGYILGGNTSYEALLSLGSPNIAVIWLDVDDATGMRILLADNELARKARMDLVQLGENLEALYQADPVMGLLGTGYDMDYLERLRELADDDTPLILHEPSDGDEDEFAKQRTRQIECPRCHHLFGGGR